MHVLDCRSRVYMLYLSLSELFSHRRISLLSSVYHAPSSLHVLSVHAYVFVLVVRHGASPQRFRCFS
jgi:hypothetical protein